MLRHTGILAAWAALAGGVLFMMFEGEYGLIHHAPVTLVGLALLGGAIARHRYEMERQQQAARAQPQAVRTDRH